MIIVEVSSAFYIHRETAAREVESKLTELVSDKARSVNASLNKVRARGLWIISDAFLLKDSALRLKRKNSECLHQARL